MRTIVENNMKEYEVFGVVYDLEEANLLGVGTFEEEDIDCEFGTIIYESDYCGIFATPIVDIMREILLCKQYYHEAENMTNAEIDQFVDNNYNELYWKCQ